MEQIIADVKFAMWKSLMRGFTKCVNKLTKNYEQHNTLIQHTRSQEDMLAIPGSLICYVFGAEPTQKKLMK